LFNIIETDSVIQIILRGRVKTDRNAIADNITKLNASLFRHTECAGCSVQKPYRLARMQDKILVGSAEFGRAEMVKTPLQSPPRSAVNETVEWRLRQFEEQWKAETQFLSDAGRIINHPAFQAIISLGEPVVPFLLTDLESGPSLWVWALPEITGENPVPEADGGNIRKMTDAWLKWGLEKGLR